MLGVRMGTLFGIAKQARDMPPAEIISWGMVDRAAPWVVGAALSGGPYDVLHDLAQSSDPSRRRSATTAALWFVRRGTDADLAAGFDVAARLAADSEPVVTNAVGIFLAHAGDRDPVALDHFLAIHGHRCRVPPTSSRSVNAEGSSPALASVVTTQA